MVVGMSKVQKKECDTLFIPVLYPQQRFRATW